MRVSMASHHHGKSHGVAPAIDGLTSVAMRGLMARRLEAAAAAVARGGGTEGSRPKARRACCIAPRVGVPTGIETTPPKFEITVTYNR